MERMARVIQTNPTGGVETDDRKYFDGLCQKNSQEKDGGDENDAPASSAFFAAFIRCLYSGNEPLIKAREIVTDFMRH